MQKTKNFLSLRIALYQPDIPGNTGTILRMGACLGVGVDIIQPIGFDLSHRSLRRAGMDYLEMAAYSLHKDFHSFNSWRTLQGRQLILFSSKTSLPYTKFSYSANDILMFGRETSGVPENIVNLCDQCLVIPMVAGRSLNLAVSAAMATGEAIRNILE